MDFLAYTVIIMVGIVGALCIVGAFHPAYEDNLAERIGMGCVGVYSCAQFLSLLKYPEELTAKEGLLYFGMFMFSVGIAFAKFHEWVMLKRKALMLD